MKQSGSDRQAKIHVGQTWLLAGVLGIALSLAGCGGDSADEQGTTTAPSSTSTEDTTTPTTPEPTGSDNEAEEPDNSVPPGESAGGSAAITIAGETVEVEPFACYTGDAAIEAFGDEDLTFAAYGEAETSSGTAIIAVSVIESAFGPNYTIFFNPTGDALGEVWQRVGTDAAVIDGDRITGEGDFDRIVGGEPTGETAAGSFEATCG